MPQRRTSVRLPAGFSLEIADLVMLRAWSEFHGLVMAIDLDVCVDGAEYEEFLLLYDRTDAARRWTIWRSRDGIVVQPAIGHPMPFDCMADVLEILIPAHD